MWECLKKGSPAGALYRVVCRLPVLVGQQQVVAGWPPAHSRPRLGYQSRGLKGTTRPRACHRYEGGASAPPLVGAAGRVRQAHEAAADGRRGGLRAVGHAQLAEDVVDVALDGGLADVERGGNLLVAPAEDDLLQDFKLAPRQVRPADASREALGDDAGDAPPARVDGADGVLQLLEEHVLEQVAL